jgi:hypothetical protein
MEDAVVRLGFGKGMGLGRLAYPMKEWWHAAEKGVGPSFL